MATKVSVIVPAYNEAARIEDTVRAILSIPTVDELVVVDDASSDATAALAKRAGATVYTLPQNLGKGGALNKGLELVSGDVIALLDGDLGSSAVHAAALIAPVVNGVADMTIAKFPKAKKKGGFGFVLKLARGGIKYFTGLEMQAPLSGQRVMTRAVVDYIGRFAAGYGVEVALTIDVARGGFRIQEVEVPMTHAETGRDLRGFLHRGKQFYHVALILLQKLLTR